MSEFLIVCLPGSTRAESFNRRLLEAAAARAPDGMRLELVSMAGVPVFDQDREEELIGGPALSELADTIQRADALLVATPEYNQSIPGPLKNTIDWLSRPRPDRILQGRPAAVIGATPGPWGTRYAQRECRHVLADAPAP